MQVSRLLLLWSMLQPVVVAGCSRGTLFVKVQEKWRGLQLPVEEAVCLILVR